MKPIFIVGMPRSGTTLLRTVVDAHPEISIGPESHYVNYWMYKFRYLALSRPTDYEFFVKKLTEGRYLDRAGLSRDSVRQRLCGCEPRTHAAIFSTLLTMYAEKNGKMRCGDKTPQHYKYISVLLDWFPQGRVVFVQRDPRSVIASLINVPWTHNYVYLHAREWVESCIAQERWADDSRVLVVKYEVFVRNPDQETARLMEFLDCEFNPAVLEARQYTHGDNAEEGWAKQYWEQVRKPVSTINIDKWQSTLSKNQIALTEHLAGEWMKKYGYVLVNETIRLGHFAYWFREMVLRNVGRGIRFLRHPHASFSRLYSRRWVDRI